MIRYSSLTITNDVQVFKETYENYGANPTFFVSLACNLYI